MGKYLTIEYSANCRFIVNDCCYLEDVSIYLCLANSFFLSWVTLKICQKLSPHWCNHMILIFLLVWCIKLIDLYMLNHPCIPDLNEFHLIVFYDPFGILLYSVCYDLKIFLHQCSLVKLTYNFGFLFFSDVYIHWVLV